MHPILFEWRSIRIHSYCTVAYLGMLMGIIAGAHAASVTRLDSSSVTVGMTLLSIPGLIGARLLFVATHWCEYQHTPTRIWQRSRGGAAMQGGVLLAVLVSPPVLAVLGLPFGAFWDVATFGMLVWLMIGKIGCLLHGCCAGRGSQCWGAFYLPGHRGIWCRRIPTQLLESSWAALLLLASVGSWSDQPFSGALFLSMTALYGSGRLAIQPLREMRDRIGPVDVQQAFAATAVTLSITMLLVYWLVSNQRV